MYEQDLALNVQGGEMIFAIPRDKQVLSVDTEGLDDGLIRLIFTDFTERVMSATRPLQVRLPRSRDPLLRLLDDGAVNRGRLHQQDREQVADIIEADRFYSNKAPAFLLAGRLDQTPDYWHRFKQAKRG